MITQLYQKLTPLWGRLLVYKWMARGFYRKYKKAIMKLLSQAELREQYREELDEIKKTRRIYMINLPYKSEYKPQEVMVLKDCSCGLRYVVVEGKRLYYPRGWSKAQIRFYHNSLLTEMDGRSPHCYVSDGFRVPKESILFDLGGAEGIFTLTNIENVKRAFIFECDSLWEEPLRKTFESWHDKVKIIPLYIGDKDGDGVITLDRFVERELNDNVPIFVKCDIEGAEEAFIKGAENTITTQDIRLAICLYHRKNAEQQIVTLLSKYDTKREFSDGYLFPVGFEKDIEFPCFRRGILRCRICNDTLKTEVKGE